MQKRFKVIDPCRIGTEVSRNFIAQHEFRRAVSHQLRIPGQQLRAFPFVERPPAFTIIGKFRPDQKQVKPIRSCEAGGQFVIRNQFRFSYQKQKLHVLPEAVGKSCLP